MDPVITDFISVTPENLIKIEKAFKTLSKN